MSTTDPTTPPAVHQGNHPQDDSLSDSLPGAVGRRDGERPAGGSLGTGPVTEPLGPVRSEGSAGEPGSVHATRDRQPSGRTQTAVPWTFVDVFAGLGVVLLASLVISAVLTFGSWDGGPARLLVSALPVWIGLLGTAIWACRRHGSGNLIRDLGLRIRWIDLAIGLGAGLGLRLVIGIWALVYSRITGQTPSGNLQPILGNGFGTGVWLVVNVLVIAVAGPLIEEIFFRGLGLRSALASLWRRADRPRYADPKRRVRYAAGATALLFAGLHISEVGDLGSAVVLLPGLFLAGWVLARLTIWSGRLGPAVITHVVFNGVAVVALLAIQ